jgi:hypothetical protein
MSYMGHENLFEKCIRNVVKNLKEIYDLRA